MLIITGCVGERSILASPSFNSFQPQCFFKTIDYNYDFFTGFGSLQQQRIINLDDETNVVTGSDSVGDEIRIQTGIMRFKSVVHILSPDVWYRRVEHEDDRTSSRIKRAVDYQVPEVTARQDGETRIVKWGLASGPLVISKYNIYRTFTTLVSFDVTRLEPIATVAAGPNRQWRDDCRTSEASVRYAVTAVDVSTREHTEHVVPSPFLPLVGSFDNVGDIKYPMPDLVPCCVVCHDIAFDSDLQEFLLVYDCDGDGDGYGDDVFAVRLDSFGSNIGSARRVSATVTGSVSLILYTVYCT